ncbi:MAG: peptidoglycan-binding protein [Clostridia bacterium]
MNEAQKVIDIALKEVGYIEKKTNSNLDSKTENAGRNNYNKYARDLDNITGFYNGKKNGYDWCDVFVDWCFVQSFGVDKALELLCQPKKSTGAGCYFSMGFYKSKGQLYNTPKVGDQIFFGNGDDIYHTGLVYKVDSKKVYTIEGNTSKDGNGYSTMVCQKEYPLNANYIAGYGRPKYKEDTKEPTIKEPVKKDTTVLEWQKVMNKVYKCGLAEDNSYGADSKAKANKYYLHYSLLKKVIVNNHVRFIQERLLKKGYSLGKYGIDGSYGPATRNAVKAFQKANGLTVDGYVGAKTTELLLK